LDRLLFSDPDPDCDLCPRLAAFREDWRRRESEWFNAPVPAFGNLDAQLLIVGLAPGLKGANRTGRPFTGDYAGDLLYATLDKFGFAKGSYAKIRDDGLNLINCRISNSVRCVPPQNKPVGAEVTACGPFRINGIAAMPNLRCILTLGALSHGATLAALGEKKSAWKFGHAAFHLLDNGLVLANSYHCSRYNTNTGRLTEEMFEAVFTEIRSLLGDPAQ